MESEEKSTNIRAGATLDNPDLSFLQPTVGAFFAEYGWYLLLISVALYLLVREVKKRRANRGHNDSVSDSVEDTAAVVRRQEALEASRRRMQEELDAQAAQYKEKKQKIEEEKRKQKIEMWESMKEGRSYRGNARAAENADEASTSTVVKPKKDKKPLRSTGYNPLTGDGGGTCSWRPGRRGPSAGG
ncbi:selenoprotein S isoform X1 [Scleropages formosus]|uniref:Selenoprotein S n=1 Tax=Scleropages formosus TaxID=113540 RepID=A0A8C9RUZ4_SCLFO|nr:selenoprotein S isoform X1 [Scleropages formosus]